MVPALLDREACWQRNTIGTVVMHGFGVVLETERDILHRLYLVTGEQPRLRVGHGKVVPRTILARIVISRFQAQHPFARTPGKAGAIDRELGIEIRDLRRYRHAIRSHRGRALEAAI